MTKELIIIIISAMPVVELRLALPYGLYSLGQASALKITLLSIFGNLIPVPFLLLFLMPISERLRKIGIFKRFFDWLFERTKKKSDLIQKYEAIGLALFVAIPLPVTGAWTGSIAASLFGIRFRYAFLAISVGVIIASIIMNILYTTGVIALQGVANNENLQNIINFISSIFNN